MASLNDTIESYLRNGSTPDDICKAINEAQRKISAEKENKDKLDKTRKALSEAFSDYLDVLTGEPLKDFEKKLFYSQFEEGLAEIEKYAQKNILPKDLKSKSNSFVRVEKNGKRDKDSEDIIKEYLKKLF